MLGCDENYDPAVNDEETFDNMEINEGLMGCIYTWYDEHKDDSVELVIRQELIDDEGKWNWKGGGSPQKKQGTKKRKHRN